jgi:Ca-activated chloride channel family protein
LAKVRVPPENLVFLVDVSGFKMPAEKFLLVKSGLKLLTQRLRPEDRVSLVACAGASGVVLEARCR